MKKIILTALATIFTFTISFSQDVITNKLGEDISVKILEINQTEIKYKKFDNPDGPVFYIPKVEVFMVRYQNGTKDIFTENLTPSTAATNSTTSELYYKGQLDAEQNYNNYKMAGTGILLVGIAIPFWSVVPAFVSSQTQPDYGNLNYPDKVMIKNESYDRGYKEQAWTMKKNTVWKNWLISLPISLLFWTTMYASASQR